MSAEVSIDIAKLDALFAPFDRTNQPGLAVGIAHHGVPVYRRGFGLANVELPVALSPSTRMRIASTSKHFTCLCIMLLAEEGKLKPEDSVRKHLPELKDWADGVTLAGLMSHTSGTRCSIDLLFLATPVMGAASGFPPEGQLAMLQAVDALNFPPGDAYSYSNGGYTLLTEVIRRVSGQSYEAFLAARVLGPAGLHDTLARPLDTDCLTNSASLHVARPGGGWLRGMFGPPIDGAGSIVSTVDDMLRWLRLLSAPPIGSPETWRRMRSPVRLNSGAFSNYGYGLQFGSYRGLQTLHHPGGVIGGMNQMLKVLGHELDIVILGNGAGNPITLALSVIESSMNGLEPPEETTEPKNLLSGTYYSPSTARVIRLTARNGEQIAETNGVSAPMRLRQDGSWLFALPAAPNPRPYIRATETEIVWEECGQSDRLKRLPEPDATGTTAITGHYDLAALGAIATVTVGAEGDGDAELAFQSKYGKTRYRLAALTPKLWSATSLAPTAPLDGIVIELDGKDLLVTSARTRRLRLRRAA